MGLIAPPTYVAPPAVEAHRFGLYSIASMPEPSGRWELGVEYEPLAGERAGLRASECVDDYTQDVEIRVGEETLEGIPFVVVGSYQCGAQSRPIEEAEERAILNLATGEERAVEYAIATGSMGNEPTFQGATDLTPTPGTPVNLVDAFGLIEQALAEGNGSIGAIHSPRLLGPLAEVLGVASRQGQHLETMLGTHVAFGGGYDAANVGPDGEEPAAGSVWVYGTGRPIIRRGETFTQPDETHYLDKSSNQVVILAQRTVLVNFDGPIVAVLVDATS